MNVAGEARQAVKSVCVFCGAKAGASGAFARDAKQLGRLIAERGLRLVYGGGRVGLMGAVADAALAHGGKVTGVIPRLLHTRELAHDGLSELISVETMHQRKQTMADRADAFIALPGGLGTLDELFEILTWGQLGIHRKAVALVNTEGYFDGLLGFLDRAKADGLIHGEHRGLLMVAREPGEALGMVMSVEPRAMERVLEGGQR